MIPSTTGRVPEHTAEAVNQRIEQATQRRLDFYKHADRETIERRLAALDEEWDIERVLEANAASACLVGVLLGATADRRWFYLPAIVGGFLLQHAIQGWCPPLPVFRRLGFRTQREIHDERMALKLLRGDFDRAPGDHPAEAREALHRAQR